MRDDHNHISKPKQPLLQGFTTNLGAWRGDSHRGRSEGGPAGSAGRGLGNLAPAWLPASRTCFGAPASAPRPIPTAPSYRCLSPIRESSARYGGLFDRHLEQVVAGRGAGTARSDAVPKAGPSIYAATAEPVQLSMTENAAAAEGARQTAAGQGAATHIPGAAAAGADAGATAGSNITPGSSPPLPFPWIDSGDSEGSDASSDSDSLDGWVVLQEPTEPVRIMHGRRHR